MNQKMILSEPVDAITMRMIMKFAAVCAIIICSVFAITSILGAPSWLVWPLATGGVAGSIPAIILLWRDDRKDSDQAARQTPGHRYILPAESPLPPRNFEGRTGELKRIRNLVQSWPGDRSAIINISGLQGLGKTALAAQFAHLNRDLFPDGQLFASLNHSTDCQSLVRETLGRFLGALQRLGEQVVEDTQERSRKYAQLTARLKLLVILDDVRDLESARRLFPRGGKCTVIVISREPITDLGADLLVTLAPLSGGEALRLLESTVGKRRVQTHPEAAGQLVAAGNPLAIQLAGTALRSRPYWSLRQAMAPKSGRCGAKAATTEAVLTDELDVIFGLLTKEERRALRCIALLDEPGFEPWELAALLGISEPDALRLSEHLSRIEIIRRTSLGRAGVVQFAVENHVWQYLRQRMETETSSARRTARLQALNDERNARSSRTDTVYRLNETIQAWRDAGQFDRALDATRDAVATAHHSGERPAEALALATLADLQADLGNLEEAHALATDACQVNGVAVPARALRCLARVARRKGQVDEAEKKLDRALAAARKSRDAVEEARVLIEKAMTVALTEDPARSIQIADEALALCRKYQDGISPLRASLLVGASFARSNALLASGYAREADDCLAEAASRASADHALWLAWLAWLRGHVALALGEHQAVIEAGGEAIERFSAMSHRYGAGWSQLLLGQAYACVGNGRLDEAITSVSDALETFQNCGDNSAEDEAKQILASLLLRQGRELPNVHDLEEAARLFQDLGDEPKLAEIEADLAATRPVAPALRRRPSLPRRA